MVTTKPIASVNMPLSRRNLDPPPPLLRPRHQNTLLAAFKDLKPLTNFISFYDATVCRKPHRSPREVKTLRKKQKKKDNKVGNLASVCSS